ncbi:MAG: amidohydrolase family protein, partial [Rhodanobacteraceae bacterium]
MTKSLVIAIAAALCMGAAQAAEAPQTDTSAAPAVTVVHCPRLIDTINGKLLGATTVVIHDDRIGEVVAGTAGRSGATVIDLPANETCMPGLIDDHVHLTDQFSKNSYSEKFRLNPADYAIRSTVYAKRTLLAGFTTVRNLGESDNSSIALRNAVNAGIVPGPRIFTAGKFIGTTGGH